MQNSRLTIVFSYASYRFTDSTVGVGGEEGIAWEIVSRLAARGNRCHVFSPRIELGKDYDNIVPHPIVGCNYRDEPSRLFRLLKAYRFYLRSRSLIRKLTAEQEIDLIHHIVPAYPGFASSVSNLGIPFVYGPAMVGDYRKLERIKASKSFLAKTFHELKMRRWTRTIRDARKVMVEINYVRKWMPQEQPEKYERMLKAVDTEQYRPGRRRTESDGQVVLFLARVMHDKGADTLLKSVPAVLHAFPDVQFVLVGPVVEPDYFSELVSSLGAAGENVSIVGPVSLEDKLEHLRHADLYCLPTLHDNAPATLFEAYSSGLPIVSTNVMGVPEIIEDGVNGYLVPPGDHEALAGAIIGLLRSPETMAQMGARNRQRATRDFTWQMYIDHIEEIYRQAMELEDTPCKRSL